MLSSVTSYALLYFLFIKRALLYQYDFNYDIYGLGFFSSKYGLRHLEYNIEDKNLF